MNTSKRSVVPPAVSGARLPAGMYDADVVIVGFRCAGAPLAYALQRAGVKVLVVDKDPFFSDQPISTHAIQPFGMKMLDQIGLGDVVRELAPQNSAFRFQLEEEYIQMAIRGTEFDSRSPRRSKLDPALQSAALDAGVDGRERTAVTGLLRDGDRVSGVRLSNGDGGRPYEVRARVVVGADGRNSTVAKLVDAPTYLESVNNNGLYWSYFEETPVFREDPRYDWGACIHVEGDEARAVFQTDSNLLLMASGGRPEMIRKMRGDPESSLLDHLARGRLTGPLLEGSRMVAKPIGLLSMRFFMKQGTGPGWALAGDAGLHMDPTPGQGITDAFRDAAYLAEAIVDGSERAMALYWRQRDADSLGLYHFAGDMGSPEFNNPLNEMLFRRTRNSPAAMQRMTEMMDRRRRPIEMFPPLQMLSWLTRETLAGNLAPWRALPRTFRFGQMIERQQKILDRALATAEAGDLKPTLPIL